MPCPFYFYFYFLVRLISENKKGCKVNLLRLISTVISLSVDEHQLENLPTSYFYLGKIVEFLV